MEYAIENKAITEKMPNTKARKKEVMKRIKEKLEAAKLNVMYAELDSAGIGYVRGYESVDRLLEDIKKRSELDYNKAKTIYDTVKAQMDGMVDKLEKGSTNAFTKLMTSPVSKSIAKSLGITLAGRAALILAPTLTSKALVGAGLAVYGLYRVIKSRKEIVKVNKSNELNNILMDLESTKEDGKYVETRFNQQAQNEIRQFLKDNGISFNDTGYRALRATIYGLDDDKKRELCESLNIKLAKGIDINDRINKAGKKLNVAANTVAGISAGAAVGVNIANTINSIDPAIVAGTLNGTVLGAWIKNISGNNWLAGLTAGVGLIGTEILEHIPVIGTAATKIFAAENLATLASAGAIGGAVVSAGLGIASVVKKIHETNKNKKEIKKYLELDAQRYAEADKAEFKAIQESPHEKVNMTEACVVDIITGTLKEEGIDITKTNPTSAEEVRQAIDKLSSKDKKKAEPILNSIMSNLNNNPKFVEDLKRAGRISVSLAVAGLAAVSVYDIVKGGVLSELSQRLFPENNLNTPVPASLDTKLDLSVAEDRIVAENGEKLAEEFFNNPVYMTEKTGTYDTEVGNIILQNGGNPLTASALINTGVEQNAIDNSPLTGFLEWLGVIPKKEVQMVPNFPEMTRRLGEMSPRELYDLTRYVGSQQNDPGSIGDTLNAALALPTFRDSAKTIITAVEKVEGANAFVNNSIRTVADTSIPVATMAGTLGGLQKRSTNELFENNKLDTKDNDGGRSFKR